MRHQELNEEAFLKAKRILNEGKAQDDIEWAMCKYLRIVLSYNGMGEFYQPYLGRYFPSMIDWKLPIVTERYQGVDIRCQDGVELIREAKDKEDAFVFADPPYLLILSILVYTFFSRMFDLMLPPVAKHSIVVA